MAIVTAYIKVYIVE